MDHTAWARVVHGLRARPAGEHGIELQAVRNIQLDEGPRTVSEAAWVVDEAALVELVLMASAWHGATEPEKAMVRVQLLRVLHGTERP